MADRPDPNIKTVKIFNKSESTAEEDGPQEGSGTVQRKKRASRKKYSVTIQKEGGGLSPGTIDQLASTRVPGSDDTKALGTVSALTHTGATVGPIAPSLGGSSKVVLANSRKKSKVILAGPKQPVGHVNKKKTAKKVHVNLKRLTRRVNKAKTIQNTTTDIKLDDIKAALIKAEFINENTKAPESMLRQIYSDLMVLKKRAL